MFGYYIEITRSKAERVPPEYRRKQTVVSGERFTFDELMSTDYPETPWFVEGLLAPGLTLLAAPPKAWSRR